MNDYTRAPIDGHLILARWKSWWNDDDENYTGLKWTVRFWSFCLDIDHYYRHDINCCFRSMKNGCYHHATGFDGNQHRTLLVPSRLTNPSIATPPSLLPPIASGARA
jgi:hypothetical protein